MPKFFLFKKQGPVYNFFSRLAVVLAIILILDFCIGNMLRYYYFNQQSGLDYRTTYSIEDTRADVLVFGSSRANHHYAPDVFEKKLHLSFYNVGRDGEYIFYHYAVLKSVLKRYSPKIVILDLRVAEFEKSKGKYDRLSSLLPYYKSHPGLRPIIEMKSPYEKLKLISSIYPFNSLFFRIAAGNMKFNKQRSDDYKGFMPLSKKINQPLQKNKDDINYQIDSAEVEAYKSFISDCASSHVPLYIICSPYYIRFTDVDKSITLAEKIAKENGITFLDYSNDPTFIENSSLFSDASHLNEDGANIFSKIIVNKLESISIVR